MVKRNNFMNLIGITLLASIVLVQIAASYPANIQAPDIYGLGVWQPQRSAMTANGNVYLTDPANNRVLILTSSGVQITGINVSEPLAIGVLPNGNLLIGHGTQVDCFTVSGTLLSSLGNGVGEFSKPNDIAVASNGNVYVTDSKEHLVKVYGSDGARLFTFGGQGTQIGHFMFPAGICLNTNQTEVYVVDQGNARIEVFNLQGQFQRTYGSFTHQSGTQWIFDGTFTRPQGIAIDALGRMYVSDLYQNDVQILNAQGEFVGRIVTDESVHNLFMLPMDLSIQGDRLVAISTVTSQVFEFSITDLVLDVSTTTPVANTFALKANYPNPFNATTRIRFSLSQNQHAKLSIWNSLGQQVALLADGNLSAGQHEYIWNAEKSGMGATSSGIYFCRLQATDKYGRAIELTQKMLLVK